MIQLNYNIPDAIIEYGLIINSKEEPSVTNLNALIGSVTIFYNRYLNNFNNIHAIGVNIFNQADSEELENCYDNSTAALENLKKRLINAQSNAFQILCPYCLIINHGTFDHYIPKKKHPVYSVLAKNLIPCCDLCNKKKLQYWRENGQRAIIHFYNDDVNTQRFLYCDLTLNGTVPRLNFRLSFDPAITDPLRFVIEKHFDRLKLIERYNGNSDPLTEVSIDIDSYSGLNLTVEQISNTLIRKANSLYQIYGRNYWYALVYEAVANSPVYINSLINN